MPKNTAEKLRLKAGMKIAALHAPGDFIARLGSLPGKINVSNSLKDSPDQVHWFVKNKAEVEKELQQVIQSLQPGVLLWIYYPKGTSKIQTDLTRDKGWESLMKINTIQWVNLISFDDTWSAFACRLKTAGNDKKPSAPKENPLDEYIDATTKTVRIPDDFENALKKNVTQKKFYETLSYSNRKEYIGWIVSAKREETRASRIAGAIDRLKKGWKNPANN